MTKEHPEKKFEFLEILGKGSFSNVYKVRNKYNGKIYAYKKVLLEDLNKKDIENSYNEIRILASLNNPFIIKFKEAFIDIECKNLGIVMEYISGGDI